MTPEEPAAYAMAYFEPGDREDGERIRLAVSDGSDPLSWTRVDDGRPVLASEVGEHGLRDPFLLRDERRGVFVLLATDLRTWPDEDWDRAVHRGSRSIAVAESADLVTWSTVRLVRVAPDDAGNAWAPKAAWIPGTGEWEVLFAAGPRAGSEAGSGTWAGAPGGHQRILATRTRDFRAFSPARVAVDTGRDLIDMALLPYGGRVLRFSVEDASGGTGPRRGTAITVEVGDRVGGRFRLVARGVGMPELVHGEGPAPFAGIGGDDTIWLLVDEFGHRGCQVLSTDGDGTGPWTHRPEARLPDRARHGSVLAVSAAEAAVLRARAGGRGRAARRSA
ncbi:hypothetical protein CMsap09_11810 [Clavibacter michiganensis]|uniref:1,4-beta-xylanase n=1 Tax=Clavibacter michiganensis TaxID=28447 RepID=A0A251XWK2_9MICO|nr:hypothetical protein CMsap09_11810 [Clavibacter michiganensis]